MCDCQNYSAAGKTIGALFSENAVPIAKVYRKWGLGNYVPSFEQTLAAAPVLGPQFAKEVSAAIAGIDLESSNMTGEESANLANTIMDMIGQAVGMGTSIANTVGQFKAGQNGSITYTPPVPNGSQPNYTPQPQTQPTTIAGLSTTQLALLLGGLVLVGLTFFFISKQEK